MPVVAVIPARYASSRLPGKPLLRATGKYLIQHVWERVCQARPHVERCLVATDDPRILEAVSSFGGEAILTAPEHPSGTDRVAEVARKLGLSPHDWVLNVQGDEPELDPQVLRRLANTVKAAGTAPHAPIFTLAARFSDEGPAMGSGSPSDPNCVKVVVDRHMRALYFSRSLIPYPRQGAGVVGRASRWLLHLGVYAFRADVLLSVTDRGTMPGGFLEEMESLEQLRWLEHGQSIFVLLVDSQAPGIDTPEDYAAFVRRATGKEG